MVALVISAGVIFLTDRSSLARFWAAGVILAIALTSQFARFADSVTVGSLALGTTGFVIFSFSAWRHDRMTLNVSYFGSALTLAAGVLGGPGLDCPRIGPGGCPHHRVRQVHRRSSTHRQPDRCRERQCGWVDQLLLFLDTDATFAIEMTAVTWGVAALSVGAAGRLVHVAADWVWAVLGSATFMMAVVWLSTLFGLDPRPGYAVAAGVLLLAIGIEISWTKTDPLMRLVTPLLVATSLLTAVVASNLGQAPRCRSLRFCLAD